MSFGIGLLLLSITCCGVLKEEPPIVGSKEFDNFVWKFTAEGINEKLVLKRLLSENYDEEILSSISGDDIVANKGEGHVGKRTLGQVLKSNSPEYVFDRNHILLKPNLKWIRQLLLTHLSHLILPDRGTVSDFSFYLIAAPPGQQTGVPMHRHADAALLLLSGTKKWNVSRPGPLHEGTNEVHQIIQTEGEIVLVPEGWWHSVQNEENKSGEPIVAIGLQKLIPRTLELSTVVISSSLAADGKPEHAIAELSANVANEKLGMISASLSTLYLRKGDDKTALKWAKQSIKKDDTLQEAIINICTASVHLEIASSAHSYCVKVIPKTALHFQTLAFYHLQMNNDIGIAIKTLIDFIPNCSLSNPCPQSIYYSLGKLQMAVGSYEDAIGSLFDAYQIDTSNAAVVSALREVRNILAQRGEL